MKEKLLNKKSIAAIVTLLCTLVGALFGVDIDESVQQTIIEVGAGLIGGGYLLIYF